MAVPRNLSNYENMDFTSTCHCENTESHNLHCSEEKMLARTNSQAYHRQSCNTFKIIIITRCILFKSYLLLFLGREHGNVQNYKL